MTRLTFVFVAVLLTSAVFAQAPAATPAPPPAAQAAAPADTHLPVPPADFTYTSGGRRDPFMTLTPGKTPIMTTDPTVVRSAQDITVDELTVKGIVFTNGAFVAMVQGAAGKTQTYSVRAGAKLRDGTVRAIDARSVVILQQVSDPLSVEKQREVRKLLRTQEEGK